MKKHVLAEYELVHTELGWLLVVAVRDGLCAVSLGDEPEALLDSVDAASHLHETENGLGGWTEQVLSLLDGPSAQAPPVVLGGTPYQERVWQRLMQIPSGETTTYSALASELGNTSARAVAAACAKNPLAVVVPCHRVVSKNGELRGYRWGLERKRQLLEREGALPA